MKRVVLIIGALLLGLAVRAQSVTYSCRYWFDQNHEQAVTTTFSDSTWQAELDVGLLSEGLHTLHLHVMDTSMNWSAPQNFLFLKASSTQPTNLSYHYWFDQNHTQIQNGMLGDGILQLDLDSLNVGLHTLHLMLKGSEYTASQSFLFLKTEPMGHGGADFVYHCWFDQDIEHKQSNFLDEGNILLDVADLEDGMHTVNVMLEGDALTAPQSFLFMKIATLTVDTADMSNLVYHCWFDQDIDHMQTDSIGDGHVLLDVADLTDGLHTVNVMLEGGSGTLTTTQSYMFMKMNVQDPSNALQYYCWFDQDYSTLQTGPVGTGVFELDADGLSGGIHIVNIQIGNESYNPPQAYLFYRKNGISRWEYWVNDDWSNRTITTVSPTVDTLDVISLLPVGHPAIRSSCFHFHPNDDEPYIDAKNEITVRVWDTETRFVDMTKFYVDEQVQQEIVAQVFERNTTDTILAPRDNQIQWFKLDAGVGDSLAFMADKACTMQLFAPSGEEVFNVTGPESITLRGLHAWEDGTYYLAVHDQTGSGDTLSVTYNWFYRYAILAYDVHVVGNGGCSTITFQGNGFNSLLDVYLVNAQNDTIRRLDIGHESNTTTTVTFNFYQVNLGVYDAVFHFYDEDIRINGALEVQEPVDIVLTSTVNYPSTHLWNQNIVTYTYTITNNGNMTAYNVPLNIYISSTTEDGITQLSIGGFVLEKLYDFIKNSYEWTEQERENLIAYSDYLGEDIYFLRARDVDEMTGDTVYIRSSMFMTTIPPFTTKTITISLTSSEPVETWIKSPTEWFAYTEHRLRSDEYCCYLEETGDALNNASLAFGAGAFLAQIGAVALGATGVGATIIPVLEAGVLFSSVISCTTGMWAGAYEAMEMMFCSDSNISPKDLGISIFGIVAGCTSMWGEVMGTVRTALQYGGSVTGITTGIMSSYHNSKNPHCPGEESKGGKSTPVYSFDPNDIYGYLSESGSHYMRQEIQNVQYEIEFENDTTLATAAAHTIIVRDTLDASKFDLNSLAARSVTIGDKRLDLNGEQTFARTLDLRPEIYVIAQIEQDYDPATGIVEWTIQSLDPMTMEPTEDPNQGVLPVNYYGDGVGFIDYSVNLLQAFADGTEINNRAGILFDQEDIIMTPTWTNIVDAVKPTSYIEEVTPVADSLNFQFVSSDNRSGVWYHTLYYRNDSTEMEWQVGKPQILGNEFMLPFDSLLTTEFLVMAVDSAGNREEKEMVAEYTYFSTVPAAITQTTALTEGWNWYSTYIEQEGINGLTMLENSLGTNGIRIQSKNDGAVDQFEYNGNNYWYGSLNELTNEQMYKVRTNAACNVAMSGYLTRMENHPITLNEGWNWIGFPIGQSLSLETAMSGFTPESDDIIKGRTASATFVSFDNYSMWYGTLNMLEPGQGYMYKSNSSSPKTLVFQNGRSWKAAAQNTHEGKAFTSNTAAFADNMLVTAVIELGGHELRSEDYELAAFVDSECRGGVKLMYVEPLDRYVAFLLAFGEATEEMHFVLTDGTDVVWSNDNMSYVTDGTIGTLTEPITLHFGTMGLNDNGAEYVNVFPNPSHGVFNIEGKGIRRIEVIDSYGQVLRSEEVKNDCLQIDLGDSAAGAYLLQIVTNRGVVTKKLVLVR